MPTDVMEEAVLPQRTHVEDNALTVDHENWVRRMRHHWRRRYRECRRHRRIARGETRETILTLDAEEEAPRNIRANLIHSTIMALLPIIYARNPEISVSPSEAVDPDRYAVIKGFSKTLQVVLNRLMVKEGKLKRRVKKAIRRALTSRIGWLKVTYQRDFNQDPLVVNRMQDIQDNLAHARSLQEKIDGQQSINLGSNLDPRALELELEQALAALEQDVEVVVAEGLVIDVIKAEHIVLDNNIESLDEYEQCRRICQVTFLERETAEEKYGVEALANATHFYVTEDGEVQGQENYPEITPVTVTSGGPSRPRSEFVCIYELWDKPTSSVYTWARGCRNWLKPPYIPTKQGEQWFPFFPLAFHLVDGYVWPMDLVDLLEELVVEYNTTRNQQAEHREISIPHWIAAKDTDVDSLDRHRDAALGEVVLVDPQGKPLNEVIQVTNPPPYNPQIYDTAPTRHDIEQLSGLGDAQRGSVERAKTLGEAEILNQGVATRTTEMQDVVEQVVEDMACFVAAALLQELTVVQVQRVAGNSAVWPVLSKEETFGLVDIEVRAGSSGKPDRNVEREQWGQLLPVIEGLIEKAEMRAMQGMDPRPQLELLKETLQRFDEKIDIEGYLPASLQSFWLQGRAEEALDNQMAFAGVPGAANPNLLPGAAPEMPGVAKPPMPALPAMTGGGGGPGLMGGMSSLPAGGNGAAPTLQ